MDLQVYEQRMGQGAFLNWNQFRIPTQPLTLTPDKTTQSSRFGVFVPKEIIAKLPTKDQLIMAKYPLASNAEVARHWDYLLTNPKGFYRDSLKAYNAQTTPAAKASYQKFIHDAAIELQLDRPNATLEALNKLHHGEVNRWVSVFAPEWTEWAWTVWASRDTNGFLNEHLKNVIKQPEAAQMAAGAQMKRLFDVHLPEGWLEKVSQKNQEIYLQLAEPETYAALLQEAQTQQAQFDSQQAFGKIMGFGIIGVIGLGMFSMMFNKGKR